MVKSLKFIVTISSLFSEGLTGCVRERKMYQKQTQILKSFPTSENRCENDARKSDAEIMDNDANMESKR